MWHGQHSLKRTAQPCYFQKHSNDSHLKHTNYEGRHPSDIFQERRKVISDLNLILNTRFKVTFTARYTLVLPSERALSMLSHNQHWVHINRILGCFFFFWCGSFRLVRKQLLRSAATIGPGLSKQRLVSIDPNLIGLQFKSNKRQIVVYSFNERRLHVLCACFSFFLSTQNLNQSFMFFLFFFLNLV